ncbi:MAG: DUF2484 family protein [Rhodobacteraceae bacterium]|nr:DUF2484 family protein [Paracoccaceae bacterium]
MSGAIYACMWAISANLIAMIPFMNTFRIHWNLARVLVLTLPFVIWRVGLDFGLGWQLAALAVAIFQLRLMLRHMWRQLVAKLRQSK